MAAALLVAGLGAFLLSTGITTGSAGAAADHHDPRTPAATPYVYVSPPPVRSTATIHPTVAPTAQLVDASTLAADGIPTVALSAYQQAADWERHADSACGLPWPLLAGIGRVESDHGRFGGTVLHTDGLAAPPIIGIALDGHASARILDTDHGRLDGDPVFDHAVGPMQFIPATWALYGIDGNHDGKADPNNIFDAARTAAGYLCAAGGNLTTIAGQTQAILTYNDSADYLALVIRLEGIYAREVPGLVVPTLPSGASTGHKRAGVPPADPGAALGVTPAGPVTAVPSPSASGGTSPPVSSPPITADPSASATAPSMPPSTPTATPTPAATPTASTSPPASPTCAPAGTPTPPATTPSGPSSPGSCTG